MVSPPAPLSMGSWKKMGLEDIPIPVITFVVGGASAISLATRNQPGNLRGKIVVGGVVGIASVPVSLFVVGFAVFILGSFFN